MGEELREIQELVVIEGRIDFPEFETIKASAEKLVAKLTETTVTSENVKESKKLIAAVRKQVRSINEERKFAKDVILQPYEELQAKIREIEAIVSVGENHVTSQIKELDTQERTAKRALLENLFKNISNDYDARHYINFEDFFQERMTNKTASIDKTELEMIEFLSNVDADLEVINNLSNSTAVLNEFKRTRNLNQAMLIVQQREIQEKIVKQQQSNQAESNGEKNDNDSKITSFEVYTVKDAELLTQFLELNHIDYKMY